MTLSSRTPQYPIPGPALLVELEPGYRVFLRNLGDFLLRRQPPPVYVTAKPGRFWADVFVDRSLPGRSLRQSALGHVFLIVALWGFTQAWLLRPRVLPDRPFENTRLTYDVSEYLPPINTGGAPAKITRKGDPAYARQPIISLPPAAENHTQTIITPPKLKLSQDVPLPNMVVWAAVPKAPPVAAVPRSIAKLTVPHEILAVIPPPVELPKLQRKVSDLKAAAAPESSVAAPFSPDDVKRDLGDLNIAKGDAPSVSLKLLVPEQRAGGGTSAPAPVAPPALPSSGGGSGAEAVGQVIALGLHPVMPSGPVNAPAGNRRGEFEAGPSGKPGASGTPNLIAGGGVGNGGSGGSVGPGTGNGTSGPPGIFVGAGPVPPGAGSVVAKTPSPAPPIADRPVKQTLMAAMRPSPADVARSTRPNVTITQEPEKVEDSIFAGKKYYSMMLNMPNLTSSGGSWIIRFAELKENGDKGDLTAPVAMLKVDPAYPVDLMQAKIEGVVTLYAVIKSDGSVDAVKILRGFDDTLDENARLALSRWRFRPATKNGSAVDLEAVVQIPFKAKGRPF